MKFNENEFSDSNGNTVLKTFRSCGASYKRRCNEHHHTECEMSLIVSGSGIYSVHGITYEFEAGDMFLFGSNEAHCITELYDNYELLNIHFEPRMLWENAENTDLLNIFVAQNKNFSNKFRRGDTVLSGYIREIETELSEKRHFYKTKVRSALYSAIIHIIRSYDCIDLEKTIGYRSSVTKSLKTAVNYIYKNLENPITLKDIADAACMTPTYFSSVFKKYNGISPWEYITIKRVEKAVELIKTTDKTKLEIAELCGFQSSSNFYKAFGRITGKHPGDF